MSKARIKKRIFNAESIETSREYALMSRQSDLPPAPYLGMVVTVGGEIIELNRIEWNADERSFSCEAPPGFCDQWGVDSLDFDEKIDLLKRDGWELSWRGENDEFDPKSAEPAEDEDEEFQLELAKLSETVGLEFHRRYEEALSLGVLAVQEKWGLDVAKKRLEEKKNVAKIVTRLTVVFFIAYGLLHFLFPELISNENTYLFLLLGWAIFILAYNEIICPQIAQEVEKRRQAYEVTCTRWRLTTGKQFGQKELEFETAEYGAGHSEAEQHYRGIKRSILFKLKNRDCIL